MSSPAGGSSVAGGPGSMSSMVRGVTCMASCSIGGGAGAGGGSSDPSTRGGAASGAGTSAFNQQIVAGSADGTLSLFDVRSPSRGPVLQFGRRPGSISVLAGGRAHEGCVVTGVAVDPFSGMVASGDSSGVVQIWNPAAAFQPLATYERRISLDSLYDTVGCGDAMATEEEDDDADVRSFRRATSTPKARRSLPPSSVRALSSLGSAVRALSWNPVKRGLLAVGGGTTDGSITIIDCTAAVSQEHDFSSVPGSPVTATTGSASGFGAAVGMARGSNSMSCFSAAAAASSSSSSSSAVAAAATMTTTVVACGGCNTTREPRFVAGVRTGSQVAQLQWSVDGQHIVSTHGFDQQSLPGFDPSLLTTHLLLSTGNSAAVAGMAAAAVALAASSSSASSSSLSGPGAGAARHGSGAGSGTAAASGVGPAALAGASNLAVASLPRCPIPGMAVAVWKFAHRRGQMPHQNGVASASASAADASASASASSAASSLAAGCSPGAASAASPSAFVRAMAERPLNRSTLPGTCITAAPKQQQQQCKQQSQGGISGAGGGLESSTATTPLKQSASSSSSVLSDALLFQHQQQQQRSSTTISDDPQMMQLRSSSTTATTTAAAAAAPSASSSVDFCNLSGSSLPRNHAVGWLDVPYRDDSHHQHNSSGSGLNNHNHIHHNSNDMMHGEGAAGAMTGDQQRAVLLALGGTTAAAAVRTASTPVDDHLAFVVPTAESAAAASAPLVQLPCKLEKVSVLIGHTARPLFLAQRQRTVMGEFMTAAGGTDATVRLWEMFDVAPAACNGGGGDGTRNQQRYQHQHYYHHDAAAGLHMSRKVEAIPVPTTAYCFQNAGASGGNSGSDSGAATTRSGRTSPAQRLEDESSSPGSLSFGYGLR